MQQINKLYQENDSSGKFLKLTIQSKGCTGNSYNFHFVDKISPTDERVKIKDTVQLVIDGKSVFKLIGSEIDFREEVLSSGFVVHNPNAVASCGCGESFSIKGGEEEKGEITKEL